MSSSDTAARKPPRKLVPGLAPPWLVAHRGDSAGAPENTEPAFRNAVEAGVEAIELDVQLTADGLPFVWHDRDVSKLGLPGRIADHDAATLKRADAGGWFSDAFRGEPPLALQEVLRRFGSKVRLLVEIKARDVDREEDRHLELASRVGRMLRVNRMIDRAWVLSFAEDVLAEVRRESRGMRTVPNVSGAARPPEDAAERFAPHAAVSANVATLTPSFAEAVHDAGKPLMTYTVNDDDAWERALACGCDAVMSDRPAWLRARAGL